MVARSCEGAGQWKKDLATKKREDNNAQYDVLQFKLDRHKTGVLQHPIVYAHKDNIFWDLYFALAVHLIIETTNSEKLFSDFFAKLGKNDSTKMDSKVSALWTHYFQELKALLEKYPESAYEGVEVDLKGLKNSKQTSYSHGRKKSANVLSDLFNLPFHVLIFRCGWAAKNIHSAFDYIFNLVSKDEACGHALAGWKEMGNGK